jgi:hypothetical protein
LVKAEDEVEEEEVEDVDEDRETAAGHDGTPVLVLL